MTQIPPVPERYNNPGKLMRRVHELLKQDPRSLPDIYRESGIPFYWLKKFNDGEYQNPSVNRVEYLYTFLTGRDLEV